MRVNTFGYSTISSSSGASTSSDLIELIDILSPWRHPSDVVVVTCGVIRQMLATIDGSSLLPSSTIITMDAIIIVAMIVDGHIVED